MKRDQLAQLQVDPAAPRFAPVFIIVTTQWVRFFEKLGLPRVSVSNAADTIHPKSVSSSPLQELTLVQSICSRTVAANRTHVHLFI